MLKKSTAAQTEPSLAQKLNEARSAHASAVAELDRLRDTRPAALIEASDAELAKLDEEIRKAARAVERTAAVLAKIEGGKAEAEQKEKAAAIAARAAAARRKSIELAKSIPERFAQIAALAEPLGKQLRALRGEIDALRESDIAIDDSDFVARGRPALEENIVSETVVDLWCYLDTGEIVGDQDAVVPRGAQQGVLPGGHYTNNQLVVRRQFKRFEVQSREQVAFPRLPIDQIITSVTALCAEAVCGPAERNIELRHIPIEPSGTAAAA